MGGNQNQQPRGLIVGNYCHDVLVKDDVVLAETLGGAVAFISAVLDGLDISADYVSKAGTNFVYGSVNHPPIVSQTGETTVFHAYFTSDPSEIRRQDRILKRVRSSDPIYPSDLPKETNFSFGMAVGVAGEISPETLENILDICDVVFVDIQALIRVFEIDGTVKLLDLNESGFSHLLPRIGFLKASAEEAPFLDIEEVRKWCCVVVTSGKDGCKVYWRDGELQISPFPAVQVDPTGAGDSFLGGLVAGLVQGLAVPDAALLGNFFGSLTVGQVGLPQFDSRLLQKVKNEMRRRKMRCCTHDVESRFVNPRDDDQFFASLTALKLPTSPKVADEVVGHRKSLLNDSSVYEEPVKSAETKP